MPASAARLHADNQLLIDLDDITVEYGGVRVLDGVSFCVHQGEFIGLIGPNGAGKTTLLRVMLGLQEPSSGSRVLESGVSVGYVPQRGAVSDGQIPMSVAEVVRMGSHGHMTVTQALSEVGMEAVANKRFGDLSGGQQQRVLIAKALAHRPSLIILDEPTTGIDEAAEQEFFALLERLSESGLTVVMVSHDIEAVVSQVSRVICLNQRVLYDGVPAEFEMTEHLPGMYGTRHRALHHQHGIHGGQFHG